jgi:uncharacterized iron-regulated membrane protein
MTTPDPQLERSSNGSLDDPAEPAPTRLRLSRHAFTRFWSAHAWAGVITALLVYVMFFLGGVVLFYHQLTVWEEPLLQRPPVELPSLEAALRVAQPESEEFYLYLPGEERAMTKVGYYLPDTTVWRMWWLDVDRGQRIPEREKAAAFVYDLHYLWHDVTGFWLQYGAGVLVFGFLLALVTGARIQLGRFRRQLFQLRPERERRVVWSDLHKVAGVFGLPFQLVYALTGSMMVLSPLLFELSIGPVSAASASAAAARHHVFVSLQPQQGLIRRLLRRQRVGQVGRRLNGILQMLRGGRHFFDRLLNQNARLGIGRL